MADRPLGVTIICIIQFIGAIIGIAIGALLVFGGLFLGLIIAVLGAIILVVGLIAFFVTFGLWKLKSWAFWITIILNIISIVTGIGAGIYALSGGAGASAFAGIIIPLIVVIYLFTVRDHFR